MTSVLLPLVGSTGVQERVELNRFGAARSGYQITVARASSSAIDPDELALLADMREVADAGLRVFAEFEATLDALP